VAVWYRQNLLVFVRADRAARFPALTEPVERPLAMVHPEQYALAVDPASNLWDQLAPAKGGRPVPSGG
jgi:hypothetical protein